MSILSGAKNVVQRVIGGNPAMKAHEQVTYTATYDRQGNETSYNRTVVSNRPPKPPRKPIEVKLNEKMAQHSAYARKMFGGSDEGSVGGISNETLAISQAEKRQGFNPKPIANALTSEMARVPFARRIDNPMDAEAMFVKVGFKNSSFGGNGSGRRGHKKNPLDVGMDIDFFSGGGLGL